MAMKPPPPLLLLLPLAALLLAATAAGASGPRSIISLDDGWCFTTTTDDAPPGDCEGGGGPLPCQPAFDDGPWRRLDLPHDFVVEGPFVYSDSSVSKNQGYKAYGKGWYRRVFHLPAELRGRSSLWIDFDGIAGNATTYLNGQRLGRHNSGYTSFRHGLDAGLLNFDGPNTLAIHVDATVPDGWWYDGGGIYRSVRLVAASPLHVQPWGVYLPFKVDEGSIKEARPPAAAADDEHEASARDDLVGDAVLNAQVDVVNDDPTESKTFSIRLVASGAALNGPDATATTAALTLQPRAAGTFALPLSLPGVSLWSLHHPHLIDVAVQVWETATNAADGGRSNTPILADAVSERTGIRSIRFDPDRGFHLNGRRVKIQGMCNHQDLCGTGVAVPPSLQAYRVRKMKAMGANAWRTAHNPPAPALLDETDRQGLLVWDENHRNVAEGQWLEDLRSLVLRDRNRPSVVIWSLCNEVLCQNFDAEAAKQLKAEVQRLDPEGGRPVSAAVNMDYFKEFPSVLDLMGFNYNVREYVGWHQQHPQQPTIASETSSAVSDRGVYVTDEASATVSSYDVNYPPWGASAEDAWCPIAAHDWMAGSFVWTGFDYKGEPTPYGWPNINSHFGVIDVCGFEKDLYFYYQSVWAPHAPMVHLVPSHWDWDAGTDAGCKGHCKLRWLRGGLEIQVDVYSNGDEVELVLNGQSLGRKPLPIEPGTESLRCRHATFSVVYAPGTLEARAYKAGGRPWATDRVTTTDGVPAALGIAVDWPLGPQHALEADGRDVALLDVRVLDGQGRVVPTTASHRLLNFTLAFSGGSDTGGLGGAAGGGARILGVGNGDPSCHEPDTFPDTPLAASRTAFHGHARVLVESGRAAGTLTLTATSEGLAPATVSLEVRNDKVRDARALAWDERRQQQQQEEEVEVMP